MFLYNEYMEHYTNKNQNTLNEIEQMLLNHIKEEENEEEKILYEIKALREEIAPLVEIYNTSIGAYKTITWVLKFMAIVGSAVAALILIKKL